MSGLPLPTPEVDPDSPSSALLWFERAEATLALAGELETIEESRRIYSYTLTELELCAQAVGSEHWGIRRVRCSDLQRLPRIHGVFRLRLRPRNPMAPRNLVGCLLYADLKRESKGTSDVNGAASWVLDNIRGSGQKRRSLEDARALKAQMLVRLCRAREWAEHELLRDIHAATAFAAGCMEECG